MVHQSVIFQNYDYKIYCAFLQGLGTVGRAKKNVQIDTNMRKICGNTAVLSHLKLQVANGVCA